VAVSLQSSAFDHYRCDRPVSLGFNSANLSKILKCAGNDDIITIKSDEDADSMTLMFESPSQDRIADFGTSLNCLLVGCISYFSLFCWSVIFHICR
jgi:proliferating cell nuclear antigen